MSDSPSPGSAANPRLRAALQYQALGLSVLPWVDKKNPTRKWKVGVEPVMEPSDIRMWWMGRPADNVAVITGCARGLHSPHPSDVVGLDLDTPEALAWAKENLQPTTWRTRTGRAGGGEHWVYRQPPLKEGFYIKTCTNAHVDGLDVRGQGGILAMPPSKHHTGSIYEWIDRPSTIEEIPYLDLTLFPPEEQKVQEVQEDLPDAPGGAMEAAQAWLQRQGPAVSGHGGNAKTFAVAASLRRGFLLSFGQAEQLMEEWNKTCEPPWDLRTLRRQIDRGYTDGSEPLGERLAAVAAADALFQVTALPPIDTPAAPPEMVEDDRPFVSLQQAKDVALTLAADTTADVAAPFEAHALQAAAVLKKEDLPGYIRLRSELKSLGTNLKEWDKAVSKEGAPLRARERQAATKINDGERTRIVVTGDDKALVDQILDVLAKSAPIFAREDSLCYLAGDILTPLKGPRLHNVILQLCNLVKGTTDKGTGDVVLLPTQLGKQIVDLLGSLLPEQLEKFRKVDQVLRFPFCSVGEDGKPYLVTEAGYDKVSRTVLSPMGAVSLDRFPSAEDAKEYILWLIHDFPFSGEAEKENYVGLLLQLILRPFIQGNTPLYIIEGNQPDVGKSLLAKLPVALSGVVPPELVAWPDKGAEEATKSIPRLLERGEAVIAWDNARGTLASSTFESLFTSHVVTLRYLGGPHLGVFPIRQLFILTSNNLETNRDGSRRGVRCRLVKTQEQEHEIKDFITYCCNNREEILSALLRMVKHWIDNGHHIYRDIATLNSYEHWSQVVGSVMRANGFQNWLQNKQEAQKALMGGDEWVAFTQAWYDKHKEGLVTPTQLWMLCQTTNLLLDILGDGSEKSQQTKLGAALRKLHESVHFDGVRSVQITSCAQRANATAYRLRNLSPLTAIPTSATIEKAS
jgi:hypothetical protein